MTYSTRLPFIICVRSILLYNFNSCQLCFYNNTVNFVEMHGDCWKGGICNTCGHGYVGNVNGMPVCCQNCEKSGMALPSNGL